MTSEPNSVLVICHVSAAELAAETARKQFLDEHEGRLVDLLCYGRTSDEHPPPHGSRFVGRQSGSPGAAVLMLRRLRAAQYDVVALSQPALALNRARGLLVAFARTVATGKVVILDPGQQRTVRAITYPLAFAELLRWGVLQAVSAIVATVAARSLEHVASSGEARMPAEPGPVSYLRTDIELLIAPLQSGGSVAHTEGVLQALVDRGNEVSYWGTGEVAGIPDGVSRHRLPALVRGNLPVEIAELISGVHQGFTVSSPPVGRGFVYQRYSLNNLAGVVASRRAKLPLVLEANASEVKWRRDFGSLTFARLAAATERIVFREAALIAAVSANAAEDIVAAGAPPERVRVVPNGVAIGRFKDAEPMPLPDGISGGFVVCFVGLFYPWHGIRFLAEAFALLHERLPDARLLLVGDGEDAPVARAVLSRNGALSAAHFTGLVPRPQAPRYMAAADVLVSPHADVHRFIGSPIKLFEYMAAGKPIVATRVGQIPEILTHESTGLLVAPEDPEAIAAALARLHEDRALGRRLGEAAQREAAAHHSWDARLAALLDGTD